MVYTTHWWFIPSIYGNFWGGLLLLDASIGTPFSAALLQPSPGHFTTASLRRLQEYDSYGYMQDVDEAMSYRYVVQPRINQHIYDII